MKNNRQNSGNCRTSSRKNILLEHRKAPKFLDKVLFREDLKELRSRLNLVKDESGHEVSYDNMLRIITDCGYTCEQGTGKGATKKERRRKYYILRKEEQKSGETI